VTDRTRVELPVKAHERRSQAERTAETRTKIIEAVVASIAEVGYQGTTATEITSRAGVTWGAVQHHFGGKEGMLVAVLEDSFNRFAARLDGVSPDGTTVEERTSLFVDRAWAHFSGPHYRATFEILLNYLSRERGGAGMTWQAQMTRAWDEVWRRIFADSRLSPARTAMLQHYAVSVLSGLASTTILAGPGIDVPADELDMLKQTLGRELAKS